jgi:hypothetical protein
LKLLNWDMFSDYKNILRWQKEKFAGQELTSVFSIQIWDSLLTKNHLNSQKKSNSASIRPFFCAINNCLSGAKVWVFWEGHKIWKKSLLYFWQERRVLCAQQRTCQKSMKNFQKKCGQVVLYKHYLSEWLEHTYITYPWRCTRPLIPGVAAMKTTYWAQNKRDEQEKGTYVLT